MLKQILFQLHETQVMDRQLGLQLNDRIAALHDMLQSNLNTHSQARHPDLLDQNLIDLQGPDEVRDCSRDAEPVDVMNSRPIGVDSSKPYHAIQKPDLGVASPLSSVDRTLIWVRDPANSAKTEDRIDEEELPLKRTTTFGEIGRSMKPIDNGPVNNLKPLSLMALPEQLAERRKENEPSHDDTTRKPQNPLGNDTASKNSLLIEQIPKQYPHLYSPGALCKSISTDDRLGPRSTAQLENKTNILDGNQTSSQLQHCKRGKALFDFRGRADHELTVCEEDEIAILKDADDDYYMARSLKSGREGDIPKSYVEILNHNVWVETQRMVYQFTAEEDDELTVAENEPIQVLKSHPIDWWLVMVRSTGKEGWVPASYITGYELKPPKTLSQRGGGSSETECKPKSGAAKIREWKDRTSRFKVNALCCGLKDGCVLLRKDSGIMVEVRLKEISIGDLEYLERETGEDLSNHKT